MLRLAILAVAAILAAASPASAAPVWPAQPVSDAGALPPTGLTFAADGTGLLTTEGFVQGHLPSPKFTTLWLRSPAGTWSSGGELPGVTWGLARVHVVGSRTVMVGMHAYAFGAYNRARWEVVSARGRLDGSFGAVRPLARPVAWVGSAAGGHGEVLAAWLDRGTSALRVARLLPTPKRPLTLAGRDAFAPFIAIGPAGHVLVAWGRRGAVEARVRAPNGVWGPVRRVARPQPMPQEIHGAVDARGRAVLAWGALTLSEDHPTHWTFTGAATRPDGRWDAKRLETFSSRQSLATDRALAAFDGDGRPFVVWPGRAPGGGMAIKLARPDGTPLDTIAAPFGVTVEDIALSLTGELALAWSAPTPGQGPGPGPFVATTPRVRSWGEPVDVGVPGTAPLRDVRLAFSPVTSQPTVAWGLVQDGAARVYAATRGP